MKKIRITLFFLCSLTSLSVIISCKKDEDEQKKQSDSIHLSGLVAKDIQGTTIGFFGENAYYNNDDWGNDSIWTEKEWESISFGDSINLDGTYIDYEHPGPWLGGIVSAACFPNPSVDITTFMFRFAGVAKVKASIVDSTFNKIMSFSAKDSIIYFQVNLKNQEQMEPGVLYRIYYSCSTSDTHNFYKGHGDIMWCDEYYPVTNCLDFIP